MPYDLLDWGWSEEFNEYAAVFPDLYPGRVVTQHRGIYGVATQATEVLAMVSGRLRHLTDDQASYPAVGDFVLLDRDTDETGYAVIRHILPRHSAFIRKAAGTEHEVQIVAANVDVVFICMSLNRDFNLRRLERYLAVAWDSGATPVVILTKADLCPNIEGHLTEINDVALGVDVVVTTSTSEEGYEPIRKYIKRGRTVAFIGSSGVGKSTLINRLLGEDMIATAEIRSDDRGRHTTTHRELLLIPSGGLVIDTPGMREMGLESADLGRAFADIETLAASCKYRDCSHHQEPGCAVRQAIEAGSLSEQRLASYDRLKKEARYEGLNSRQIEQEKIQAMFGQFGGIKNARDYAKSKNARR